MAFFLCLIGLEMEGAAKSMEIYRLCLSCCWTHLLCAVVGLLCYALSSSFNRLFGNWNLFKIILYTLFSFIISLMILYANIWKSSSSLRFKAHTAFLVLTITSVYSFFFDKVVNGKPDSYSLVSCASFAIMSLSLSGRTHCGVEIDLLYFFLGCLIVQLMKISLQLLILGAGFSYSLIILRSSLSSTDDGIENEYFDPQAKETVLTHGLHRITFEVMSYVSLACMSRKKLEQILQAYPKVDNQVEASSFFLKQMEQIMEMLPKKLIAKLKNCKDPALRHIFKVNNRSHIEAINQFYKLETIFGNDWFQNNKAKIRQHIELYKRISWNEVLYFLKPKDNDLITRELFKEKIHLFNTHFEEICRVQSDWFVFDNKLREEIISSVENVLLPAYGIFIGRLQYFLGNQAYEYIKYGMFEIQDQLNQLFRKTQTYKSKSEYIYKTLGV
ncbi:hypothetical protein RYX36_006623 [Vicia faba]